MIQKFNPLLAKSLIKGSKSLFYKVLYHNKLQYSTLGLLIICLSCFSGNTASKAALLYESGHLSDCESAENLSDAIKIIPADFQLSRGQQENFSSQTANGGINNLEEETSHDGKAMNSHSLRKLAPQLLSPALTPHDPITINGDDDFVTQGWDGSGIKNNPYQLADLEIINTTSFGIDIRNTRAYFVINNSWIDGTDTGINLDNVSNGLILSSTCINHSYQGIAFTDSWNCSLSKSTITDCEYEGFSLVRSNETKIINNFVSNVGRAGVFLRDSSNNTLSNNTISSTGQEGIYLEYSNYSVISDNKVTNDSWGAIIIRHSINSTVLNNTVFDSGKCYLYYSNNSIFSSNSLVSANGGIELENSGNSTVSANTLTASNGIYLMYSSRSIVQYNNVSNTSARGIRLSYSGNVTVQGNILTNCSGMYITYSPHLAIHENSVTDILSTGILIEYCNFSNLEDNSFLNVSFSSTISLSGCHYSIISNNTAMFGGSIDLWESSFTVISANTLLNISGISVRGSSLNCEVSANILTNLTLEGLYIEADNCFVSNNVIKFTYNGIRANYVENQTITGNVIINSTMNGIGLETSNNCTIKDNIIANSSRCGISLWNCSYTHARRNNVTYSEDVGIDIAASYRCTAINNTVIASGRIGIALGTETRNCLLWGNILSSSAEVNGEDYNGTNQWDNGEFGNFWDDYKELDENEDGIGDVPYLVTQLYNDEGDIWKNITDRYPMIQLRGFIVQTVKVKYPNGGELLSGIVTIRWEIYGLNEGSTVFDILYSDDYGNSWIPIIEGIQGTSYNWDTSIVEEWYEFALLIKVIATDGQISVEDVSDDVFSVRKWSTSGRRTLSSPGMTLIPLSSAIVALFIIFRKDRRF